MKDQKGFTPVLVLVLVAAVGFVLFFVYKNFGVKNLGLTVPATSPTSTSSVDTKDWKIYNAEKNGVAFKYPGNWEPVSLLGMDSLPVYLKDSQSEIFSIEIYFIENTTVDDEIATDATIDRSKGIPKGNNINISGKSAVQITGVQNKEPQKGEHYTVTFIQKENNVVKVVSNYTSAQDTYFKILSTFKFTQ